MGTAVDDCFSPTYHVPSGTSRAKSEGVFPAQASTPRIKLVARVTGPNAAGIISKVHDKLMLAAKGARKWGVCGHTFHNISCTFGHFSCEIGGCFFGINKHDRHPARSRNGRSERGRHHTKGTGYVVNSLAALLGASAAIWS